MHIWPAIDLRGGKCVRLQQGDYRRETVFGNDPVEVALRWREAGADRLHLVDLDGAREERRDVVEVRTLENKPLLLLHRGFGTRDLFDAACHMAHIRPNIFLESSAPATLLALAKAGCGVAILPGTASLPRSGLTIQKLVQEGTPVEFRLAVHWNPQRFFPPYAERFVEVLSAIAAKEYVGVARNLDTKPNDRRRGRRF
jgi:DNA-binding transcriptional LysR family regulator